MPSNGFKHGHTGSPEYNTWKGMKARCSNPKATGYHLCGGKGITVCDEWRNSFEAFLADMGERPQGTTLERLDGSKGYFKENCKWATSKEQSNNRASNRLFTFKGVTLNMSQWAERLGMNRRVLKNRLHIGWSFEQAVTHEVTPRGRVDPDKLKALYVEGASVADLMAHFDVGKSRVYQVLTPQVREALQLLKKFSA